MATVLMTQGSTLLERYDSVRHFTEELCAGLELEDYVVQSMDDVSPTKWHLAHTSWFFETFVLKAHKPDYRPLNPAYQYLFNSYYVQAGERHCRAQRGYISRPTVREVFAYRAYVDEQMSELLARADHDTLQRISDLAELGINHEQQHQELMLTDIKHVFSVNPLRPVYRNVVLPRATAAPLEWIALDAGLHGIGHDGNGFAYDNEGPRHRVFVEPFAIASRLVTNGEYLEFMAAGGYTRPELWLSAGWDAVQQHHWSEPFYWEQRDGKWYVFTLAGMREVDEHAPVCHVSYFEADAYARWRGFRLPTESEWEVAATNSDSDSANFVESGFFHPCSHDPMLPRSLYGDVWQWTRSQYSPYPGFQPAKGAVGEYNGKFMCNQFVLRGGSCATSRTHIRRTYRNFFAPGATWQFMGIRLAQDVR
ncbi:MAG: ergothioneine biosynthesis protein EgtB [Gemmatimonadota bacterium]